VKGEFARMSIHGGGQHTARSSYPGGCGKTLVPGYDAARCAPKNFPYTSECSVLHPSFLQLFLQQTTFFVLTSSSLDLPACFARSFLLWCRCPLPCRLYRCGYVCLFSRFRHSFCARLRRCVAIMFPRLEKLLLLPGAYLLDNLPASFSRRSG
jgi:hypothetical protein